jgi:FkbM family methyltransferase
MADTRDFTPFVAECHGVKLPDSPLLNPTRIARINAARYEGQEIAGALNVVQPGDRVLELGVGTGLVGAIVAHNAKPEKVMSFEANPALIEHINALYRFNHLEDRMEVNNALLVSDPKAPKSLVFHVRSSFLGSSLIDTDTRATTPIDVPTRQYAQVHQDFRPDVLLIDIEGGELEFLRHASLKGVRAIVIEFHPDAYGKDGMRECKSILEKAGFTKVPEHCTRHVWTCTFTPMVQAPVPDRGWSRQVNVLKNACVVPPAETGFVQQAGVLDAAGTYQASGALWRNGRALTTAPQTPPDDLPLRKGTWLWGGVLWMHFGHFLVESMARLWALDHLEHDIDGILFVPKRPRNKDEVIDFQRHLVAAMGTQAPIISVTEPERVERLILPGQGFGLGSMITGTPEFRAAVAGRFAKEIPAQGPEKIYISRSRLPSGRGTLIGETELEAHLQTEGYTIYHPEKHDIHHQIATYKAAKSIIAAEGSALHLVGMVSDGTSDVAMIVRRPSGATRNIEIHLEAFSGSACTSVTALKRSWKPLGKAKPRNWMGELDMPALQTALAAAGFVTSGGPQWPPLDAATVQDRLGDRFEQVA